MTKVVAPASSSAFLGSVSSDSSKRSVAMMATRIPLSFFSAISSPLHCVGSKGGMRRPKLGELLEPERQGSAAMYPELRPGIRAAHAFENRFSPANSESFRDLSRAALLRGSGGFVQCGREFGLAGAEISGAQVLLNDGQFGGTAVARHGERLLQDPDGIAIFAAAQANKTKGIEDARI